MSYKLEQRNEVWSRFKSFTSIVNKITFKNETCLWEF